MFIECEKWRVEFGVDQLKRTFHFDEREKVNQYYPQYYHKIDKVWRSVSPSYPSLAFPPGPPRGSGVNDSLVDHYILNNWIRLIFPQCTKLPLRNVFCRI